MHPLGQNKKTQQNVQWLDKKLDIFHDSNILTFTVYFRAFIWIHIGKPYTCNKSQNKDDKQWWNQYIKNEVYKHEKRKKHKTCNIEQI